MKKVTSDKVLESIKKWKKKNPEKQKEYNKTYNAKRYAKNPELLKENFDKLHKAQVCKIIKNHHEDLKDDPERLSTDFIQRLIGIKCEPKKKINENEIQD